MGLQALGQVGTGLGQGSGWLRAAHGLPAQEVILKQAQTQPAHGREIGQEGRLSTVTPGRAVLTRTSDETGTDEN